MAVPWERVTGSFSMDFIFLQLCWSSIWKWNLKSHHLANIKLSKPLCLLCSSACNLLIPTPGIFRQSIGQLCSNTKLRGWELHRPTLFVHYNVQASAVFSRIYFIISLVLCIFICVCSEEKQQLFSQLKSKWPHHLLEKRKIVLGLK